MKILQTFLNTLTANDTYSINSKDKWMQKIKMHLSQEQIIFSEFFSAVFESTLNLEFFQKEMTLIAYVYPKLPTKKEVLR